ncbi:DivIVA domain-containing protein [Hazenella coriacea]|uniref:DivIVA domain-containing protein n=1 Tax=Hazenella coriacea TaxID=1179467 RepID=A0A4R3L1A1_9BACL|nr:DivIVA domain-containing protein [Hazenella coriacea]
MDQLLKILKWIVLIVLFIITASKIDGWLYWSTSLLGVLIVIFCIRSFRLRTLPSTEMGEMSDFSVHDVRSKKFKRSLLGFDADEVNAYLSLIIQDFEGLGSDVEEAQSHLSVHGIHSKQFKRSFIGYDVDEVNDFLDQIIRKYKKLDRV